MDLKQRIASKRQEAEEAMSSSSAKMAKIVQDEEPDLDAIVLPISQIEIRLQGRRSFKNLDALAEDIREKEQLQPIIVKEIDTNRYLLVAGERRYRAIHEILKQDTILARVRRRDESDTDIRFVQIAENAQRDDYLPLELANELADLKAQTGLTLDAIAKRIGKSKGFVSKFISLSNAPEAVKQAIVRGDLTATGWFNNKALVSEQLTQSTKNAPPITQTRTATLAITLDAAKAMAQILQQLAAEKGLAEIDVKLSGKVSKKQLQAILVTRANEIANAL